jgi:type VI secretion system protein ImpF
VAEDPRRSEGARALLFDRLVDMSPNEPAEVRPLRVLSVDELRESVRRELGRLLNTRCTYRDDELEGRALTVLEYGLPDYSAWYTRDPEMQKRLSALIKRAVEAYEPRLGAVRVRIIDRADDEKRLRVQVDGTIRIGAVIEPVSFPLALEGEEA